MKNQKNFYDDNRTIADMSKIDRTPLLIPKLKHLQKLHENRLFVKEEPDEKVQIEEKNEKSEAERPWEADKNDISKEESRAYFLGTMSAALVAGGIFALVFFLLILCMVIFL